MSSYIAAKQYQHYPDITSSINYSIDTNYDYSIIIKLISIIEV
jgi:hypothetical protein